jgi:hypothetical protein
MSPAQTRAIFAGNQGGKTTTAVYDAVLRILGIHPIKERNILNKPIRFVSKSIPKDKDDEENQQFVEFKKFFPKEFIVSPVTVRSPIMSVRRPNGEIIKVEFMSSFQELDAFMSVQRSALYQDEEIDKIKWDENQIRLFKEGGDTTITLTPVRGLDWTYDLIWQRARRIYRSKIVSEYSGMPRIEETGSKSNIECFVWSSYDNPVMDRESIDSILENIGVDLSDEDDIGVRVYSVFRQHTGRIYKTFNEHIHVIKAEDYFDKDMFKTFWNFRIIDYHPQKPWYISYVAASPRNEWFVWNELLARHDTKVTLDIREEIKRNSIVEEEDDNNRATLIDPLAEVKQPNTGHSVFEDLSQGQYGLRRTMPADTKNSQGRMNIKMRLKNSIQCKEPWNNMNKDTNTIERYGEYLPTLWFMDNCKVHKEHFKSWRYVNPSPQMQAIKTVKQESQKWSDFCRNLEFLGALDPVWHEMAESSYEPRRWFQGRKAVG